MTNFDIIFQAEKTLHEKEVQQKMASRMEAKAKEASDLVTEKKRVRVYICMYALEVFYMVVCVADMYFCYHLIVLKFVN